MAQAREHSAVNQAKGPLRVDLQKLIDRYESVSQTGDEEQYRKLESLTELLQEVALQVPPYIDEGETLKSALKSVRLMAKISIDNPRSQPGQSYGFCEKHNSRYDKASGCKKCKKI